MFRHVQVLTLFVVRSLGYVRDMDRGSAKHGRQLDEQMAHEVQGVLQGGSGSRASEWHDPEPAGDDQPDLRRTAVNPPPGSPPGMTYEEVEQRSRLGRFIPKSRLPGERDELIAGAHDMHAPDDVLRTLAQLPAGERFVTVNEVWAALGHNNEPRRT